MSANPEPRSAPQAAGAAGVRPQSELVWRRFGAAASPEEFCQSWLELQCQLIGGVSDGVVVLQKPGIETFAPLAFWPARRREGSSVAPLAERSLREGRGIVQPAGDGFELAYPVRVDGRVRGVVALALGPRDEAALQSAMRQLQWGAGWLEVLLRRHADPAEEARQRHRLLLQITATFLEPRAFRDAAAALVTEIATQLGCDRVVLACLHGGKLRIEAVSHAAQFDRRANLLDATLAAMHEALDQGEPIVYPPDRDDRLVVTLAHAELAQHTGAGGLASYPLMHEGRAVGALGLQRAPGLRFDAPSAELLEGLAAMLGPLLVLQRARERSLPRHAAEAGASLWRGLVGPGHAGLKLATLLVVALGLFFTFATGTYRVSADALIEGEVQRAITAPFAAYVKESSVRAGDTVKAGQLLARLDDRDLRVERTRLAAQREQLGQQYRDAMSRQERAQVRIVSAQIAQTEAQIALLEEQLARTEVTAPFDGVVVSGDLTQSLGAPLERGQVLFEIAPLDAYRVVLYVDEHDIADVRPGQAGELALTPMPGRRLPLAVESVTPVTSAKDGRNVFRVEAALGAEVDARLRPGMQGVAKIEVEERRLVSIWTRGLLNWLRLKAWAWLP